MDIAIVGAGMIGRGWILPFADAGHITRVHSRSRQTSDAARDYVLSILPQMREAGLITTQEDAAIADRIIVCDTLEEAVSDAGYIQENAPEDLDLKRNILSEIEGCSMDSAIIGSSTSAIMPSVFTSHLARPERCLVVHPLNPPYLIPAVEILPTEQTPSEVLETVVSLMQRIGQKPILVEKEIEGFIVNRLQGALLNEAFNLLAGGYANTRDIDRAVKDGLALRWSFMGPFETIDLNAPGGIEDYTERYNGLYAGLHAQMSERADWQSEVQDTATQSRRKELSLDQLSERCAWRDRRLMALAAHKRVMREPDED